MNVFVVSGECMSPQQSATPKIRIPQVCSPPAETVTNSPSGVLACPLVLVPQQVTVPSVRIPQVWSLPAVTP